MSMSVCLFVYYLFTRLFDRLHISKTTRPNLIEFVCMLPVVVARSSSGGVAIRYVLPVLWMSLAIYYGDCSTSIILLRDVNIK